MILGLKHYVLFECEFGAIKVAGVTEVFSAPVLPPVRVVVDARFGNLILQP